MFEGALELLAKLTKLQKDIALVSSSPKKFLEISLDHYGLSEITKPDKAILKLAYVEKL